MSNDKVIFLKMLVESLQLLAAPAEQQIAAFPPFVHIPDEIALTFHDAFLLTDNLVDAGLITPLQRAEVERLDRIFDQMTDDKSLWTIEMVGSAPQWKQVRTMAKDILFIFNEEPKSPELFWIQYVPGQKE